MRISMNCATLKIGIVGDSSAYNKMDRPTRQTGEASITD